ncbi:hypothetical protein CXZ10_07880 [Pleomorphomonas diazotrophica]|uniref:histidine kinase n=1 Tax=Pleomorphomonas diazotrophica TaxID=1166257 RepID=A0A1I4UUK0_9HYPH|nr:HAMP domain-containing sensor histidine kinase [Pleomorphomonas diazotrophica]PKR89807.1 hypothetical protein CXZ10_07880 [Pleomorphomonas diazotrophica]SFM92652.1 Signal transduction histidine kinase [Pleomorphomonas diazotrophica]
MTGVRSFGLFRRLRVASIATAAAIAVLVAITYGLTLFGGVIDGPVKAVLADYATVLVRDLPADAGQADVDRLARTHRVAVTYHRNGMSLHADSPSPTLPQPMMLSATAPAAGGASVELRWPVADAARFHLAALAILIVLVITVLAAHHVYQARLLAPLRWLRRSVEAVAAERFDTVAPMPRGDGELAEVARAFDDMARRVRDMLAARERLLGDVSHELRSPLTRIKVALEFIPEGEKQDQIRKDVGIMESLVATLLERERVARGAIRMTSLDLAALVRSIVQEERRRPLALDVRAANTRIRGDADLLRILSMNLIDNAIKFSTEDDDPIEVVLEGDEATCLLRIIDHGVGIPETDRLRVFDPFVRLSAAREHGKGYGLGLDLCRRIANAHDARIEIVDGPAGGTEIRTTFSTETGPGCIGRTPSSR